MPFELLVELTDEHSSWWRAGVGAREALPSLRGLRDLVHFLRVAAVAAAGPADVPTPAGPAGKSAEPAEACASAESADVARVFSSVDAAVLVGRPVIRSGCLTKGSPAAEDLQHAGINITLCSLGQLRALANQQAQVHGHCWLVKEGMPFLEARARSLYSEIFRLPRTLARS